MSKNILYEVDFGHVDAEADPNLINYFIETDSYHRIFKGEKMYVVGRKGTGKSAIYLSIRGLRHDSVSISGLSFDDYPWQTHKRIKDESKSQDFAYVNSWKYVILLELTKLLLKEFKDDDPKIKDIKSYLEVVYGTLTPSFKEFFVDKMKRIKCIELPKISWKELSLGKFEFEEKAKPEEKLIASINIVNGVLQERIFELMSKDKMYFILFDKLDDGWDNTEEAKASIIGLLRASRDFNLESKNIGKHLRCVPFLRSDIYDCLQYNDKNKSFSDIEFLNWDSTTFYKLINKRIATSIGMSSDQDSWKVIFDNKLLAKGTTSFKHMVKRTLLRPRDIIQFCDFCKKQAIQDGHNIILKEDVYEAEKPYSEFIYREFIDEAHKQHPYVEQLFEILRGLRYERFAFNEFESEFKKISALARYDNLTPTVALKILFDFSIIGVERIGGAGGGSSFEFKYTDPLIQPEFTRNMVTHPALKKHLKLTEPRKKKK
jgi:energy-coupling factor transporter ATP-binding protein EcfA2